MSFGLTQIGATPYRAAYSLTPAVRAPGVDGSAAPSEALFKVTAVSPASAGAAEKREQVRDRVMAERGVDMLGLYRMGSQDRIRAEAAILVETALRQLRAGNQARAEIRTTGNFVDLRV